MNDKNIEKKETLLMNIPYVFPLYFGESSFHDFILCCAYFTSLSILNASTARLQQGSVPHLFTETLLYGK